MLIRGINSITLWTCITFEVLLSHLVYALHFARYLPESTTFQSSLMLINYHIRLFPFLTFPLNTHFSLVLCKILFLLEFQVEPYVWFVRRFWPHRLTLGNKLHRFLTIQILKRNDWPLEMTSNWQQCSNWDFIPWLQHSGWTIKHSCFQMWCEPHSAIWADVQRWLTGSKARLGDVIRKWPKWQQAFNSN